MLPTSLSTVRLWSLLALSLLAAFSVASSEAAELSAAQKEAVKQIAEHVKAAATQYQAGDYEASGKSLSSAMDAIDESMKSATPEFYDAIAPALPRIVRAQAMLELEGVILRPFTAPERPAKATVSKPATKSPTKPTRTTRPGRGAKPAAELAANTANPNMVAPANPLAAAVEPISFTKNVAPILVQHCGRCHVGQSRGDFSMATFASLMKGPPEGVVLFPGDVQSSRLIETIESRSMPPSGGGIPAGDLKVLKDWIAGGARYDGQAPDMPLAAMASAQGAAPAAAPPVAPVKRATGKETVSFAKDVAPILLENCSGCHIDAMQVRGGLQMDNFALLLKGGDSGAIVEGGKAAMSLLIRKLKGEEGQRMPANRPPLSDEQITLISKWIDEGAALDSGDENQPLAVMSSLAWAKSATPEQLSERRASLAMKNFTLFLGETPRNQPIDTERFHFVGEAGAGTMKAVQAAADAALKQIAPFTPTDHMQGRITVFVLPRRYDYNEFATMVEKRSIPTEWQSHWRYDGIDAYVAIVAGSDDKDDVLRARLVGPLASLALATRGPGVPRWFAEGVGRFVVSKTSRKDSPVVEGWNRDLPSAVVAMKDGASYIKNELPPEQTDLIAYGIATALVAPNQRRQYDALLRKLSAGETFDRAFEETYGMPAADYIAALKGGAPGRKW